MPLGGNFDLYDMNLEFLSSKYSPAGVRDVDPEALYRTILTYQAKNDRTAKATIPEDYTSPGSEGEFSAKFLRDPFSEEPFEISVIDIEVKDDIGFKSKYAAPKVRWEGDGVEARMEIAGGGCGIASSSGSFAMKPLWQAETEDGEYMELFEGTLTFRASFSSLYNRKGHGRGIPTVSFPFWAVRALD